VTPGSAADHAGVKQGDVILSFNGTPVSDANALRNQVAAVKPGSKVTMVVNRDGRRARADRHAGRSGVHLRASRWRRRWS
jgi:serine protease Do